MIFFIRSFVADLDGRLNKYFGALDAADVAYHFIGWNKDGSGRAGSTRQTLFQLRAQLGGGWRNVYALLRFNIFILTELWRSRKRLKVVHAVDLDTAVVCWIFCKLFRKAFVFDIYDKYTAVRNISGFARELLDRLETHIAKSADLTLIVSGERYRQHGLNPASENVQVLENVPMSTHAAASDPTSAHRPWKLGYFGVLEPRHRGLEDLLAVAAAREDVELHIAGYGSLARAFAAAASRHAHIRYYGPMCSQEGLALMAQMDVVVGMYYLTVPNHAFASPNKYYEHLLLRRGMLSTLGTPPGGKVVAQGSGWAIAEGASAIAAWLDKLKADDILTAGASAGRVWDEKYASYYSTYYKGLYISCIKKLLGR